MCNIGNTDLRRRSNDFGVVANNESKVNSSYSEEEVIKLMLVESALTILSGGPKYVYGDCSILGLLGALLFEILQF